MNGAGSPRLYENHGNKLTVFTLNNGVVISYETSDATEKTDFDDNFKAGSYAL